MYSKVTLTILFSDVKYSVNCRIKGKNTEIV